MASSLDREILVGRAVATVSHGRRCGYRRFNCVRVNSVVGSLFDPSSEASTRNSKGFRSPRILTGKRAVPFDCGSPQCGYVHPVS